MANEALLNKVTQGDCLELLSRVEDCSVDVCITSPPYNLGGDFHTSVGGKRVSYGGYGGRANDNLPESDYQANQVIVLNELHRVLTDDGLLFYNHKNRIKDGQIISPFEWITKSNFIISQVVILNFKSTANVDKRRFFPVHELLFVLKKDAKTKLNNSDNLTDVWEMKKVPRRLSGHPATFHVDLPMRCLSSIGKTDAVVLDPYAGTGTTLFAAKKMSMKYIGFELEETYKNIADGRLAND